MPNSSQSAGGIFFFCVCGSFCKPFTKWALYFIHHVKLNRCDIQMLIKQTFNLKQRKKSKFLWFSLAVWMLEVEVWSLPSNIQAAKVLPAMSNSLSGRIIFSMELGRHLLRQTLQVLRELSVKVSYKTSRKNSIKKLPSTNSQLLVKLICINISWFSCCLGDLLPTLVREDTTISRNKISR